MVHVPNVLHVLVLLLSAGLATAVALTRNTLRQIVVNGFYGLALTMLFVVLQAPDVALSMLVVATVAYPLIVLAAIARSRGGRLTDPSRER
jgi:uncharacterized MnhB-related membrane protein